jgi:hypothetical protein
MLLAEVVHESNAREFCNFKLDLEEWILRTSISTYKVWWVIIPLSHYLLISDMSHRNDIAEDENKKWPDMVKTVNDTLVEDRRWLNTSQQTGSPT